MAAKQTIEFMAQAFMDDPMFVALVPLPAKRIQLLRAFMNFELDLIHVTELGVDVGHKGKSAGLIQLPDHKARRMYQLTTAVIRILVAVFVCIHPRVWKPGIQILRSMLRGQASYGDSAVYLAVLAVAKDAQGQGLGKTTLNTVIDYRSDLPVYLETTKPENVGYYCKFGFEVCEEVNVPPLPPLWMMRREATPPISS